MDHPRAEGRGRRPPNRQRRRKLAGLTGDVRARSTNGGITGEGIMASNVDAAVTNGGVEIELGSAPAVSGSIELESVNGGVSLTLPGDSKADITARCVNGGVSINGLSSTSSASRRVARSKAS